MGTAKLRNHYKNIDFIVEGVNLLNHELPTFLFEEWFVGGSTPDTGLRFGFVADLDTAIVNSSE